MGLIILTPPLKPEFMSTKSKYRAYQKGLVTLLHTTSPYERRKEAKPTWENPPLNMDCKTKL